MVSRAMYQLLADILLVIHVFLITFVVLGFVLIVVGMVLRWSWVGNFWFRFMHLLTIGIVVAEAWCGKLCPLTTWESSLRELAGGVKYSGTFIQYWLQKLFFYDFAPCVFTYIYTIFGALVLITWILKPPRLHRAKGHAQQTAGGDSVSAAPKP